MCNNRFNLNSPESEHYRILGEYAAMLLRGKSLEEVAKDNGLDESELLKQLEEIKTVNPLLYKQVQEAIKNL